MSDNGPIAILPLQYCQTSSNIRIIPRESSESLFWAAAKPLGYAAPKRAHGSFRSCTVGSKQQESYAAWGVISSAIVPLNSSSSEDKCIYVVVPVLRFAQLTFAQLTDGQQIGSLKRTAVSCCRDLWEQVLRYLSRFLKAVVLMRPCAQTRLPSNGTLRHGNQRRRMRCQDSFGELSTSSRFRLCESIQIWQIHFAACNGHFSLTSLLQQQIEPSSSGSSSGSCCDRNPMVKRK